MSASAQGFPVFLRKSSLLLRVLVYVGAIIVINVLQHTDVLRISVERMGWFLKVLAVLVLFFSFVVTQQPPCNFYCGENAGSEQQNNVRTVQGPPGKQGPQGLPGNALQCECSSSEGELCRRISGLEKRVDNLEALLNQSSLLRSCLQIKQQSPSSGDGLYKVEDLNGDVYKVYCDMTTDGGGWTLVSSIHENNIGDGSTGKCTVGDKWSSEQGNDPNNPSGDGNWNNKNVFGRVTAATSDDYKNQAYFELQANNIMIWQVPNDTPLRDFKSSSYLRYRTNNGFLTQYGGNLFHLYSDHFPIKSKVFTYPSDSGPAIPITFDAGDAVSLLQHFPANARSGLDAGYIQFRAISVHQDAFALCPGVRNKPSFNYPSQSCLGSAGHVQGITYCGDFSGLKHNNEAIGTGWSADETFLTTSFLVFYR